MNSASWKRDGSSADPRRRCYSIEITGDKTVGLPTAPYGQIDPALAKTIQQAVWKIVATHSEVGVAEP